MHKVGECPQHSGSKSLLLHYKGNTSWDVYSRSHLQQISKLSRKKKRDGYVTAPIKSSTLWKELKNTILKKKCIFHNKTNLTTPQHTTQSLHKRPWNYLLIRTMYPVSLLYISKKWACWIFHIPKYLLYNKHMILQRVITLDNLWHVKQLIYHS